jgi:hypothetical protein
VIAISGSYLVFESCGLPLAGFTTEVGLLARSLHPISTLGIAGSMAVSLSRAFTLQSLQLGSEFLHTVKARLTCRGEFANDGLLGLASRGQLV